MLIPLGFFGGAGAISWVTRTWANSGNYEYSYGLFPKADKSAIGIGQSDDQLWWVLTSFNESGVVTSRIKNNNSFPNGDTSPMAGGGLDSSENLYSGGYSYQNGGFSFPSYTKWNSSLGLTFSYWWNPGYNNSNFHDTAVNASGNAAITYRTNNSHPVLFYVNTTGDIQYGIRLHSGAAYFYGVGISASNNTYAAFATSAGNNKLVKLNSSGTVQWFKSSTQFNNINQLNGLVLDDSENVYVAFTDAGSYPRITKWNSSGGKIWETRIDQQVYSNKITVDKATGDVYVLCDKQGSKWFIVKLNSNGVIQWSREISSANASTGTYATITFNNGMLLLALPERTSGNLYQTFWWKIPADGSKTGTYTVGGVAQTYGVGAYTVSTPTETWSDSANTASGWGVMGTKTNTGSTQAAITSNTSTVQL